MNRLKPGAAGPALSSIKYETDLLGNIQQALAGLQGFDIMALELIQNTDDVGARALVFDVRDEALFVRNDAGKTGRCVVHVAPHSVRLYQTPYLIRSDNARTSIPLRRS